MNYKFWKCGVKHIAGAPDPIYPYVLLCMYMQVYVYINIHMYVCTCVQTLLAQIHMNIGNYVNYNMQNARNSLTHTHTHTYIQRRARTCCKCESKYKVNWPQKASNALLHSVPIDGISAIKSEV